MNKAVVAAVALTVAVTLEAGAKVGGGDVHLKSPGMIDAIFSHDAHVAAAGLKCTACHPKPYLDTRKHQTVAMKEMEKGKSCGVCHDGKKAFGVTSNCRKCHPEKNGGKR